jgi:hypothetical protein
MAKKERDFVGGVIWPWEPGKKPACCLCNTKRWHVAYVIDIYKPSPKDYRKLKLYAPDRVEKEGECLTVVCGLCLDDERAGDVLDQLCL